MSWTKNCTAYKSLAKKKGWSTLGPWTAWTTPFKKNSRQKGAMPDDRPASRTFKPLAPRGSVPFATLTPAQASRARIAHALDAPVGETPSARTYMPSYEHFEVARTIVPFNAIHAL